MRKIRDIVWKSFKNNKYENGLNEQSKKQTNKQKNKASTNTKKTIQQTFLTYITFPIKERKSNER